MGTLNTAQEELQSAMRIALSSFNLVSPLREVIEARLGDAQSHIASSRTQMTRQLLVVEGLREWLGAIKATDEEIAEEIGRRAAHDAVINALVMTKAAEIVFHHAIVCEAAERSIKAIARLGWKACVHWIGDRKIDLRTAWQADLDALVRGEIMKKASHMKRAHGLLFMLDRIMEVCGSNTPEHPLDGYVYNRERILTLTDIRDCVVHGLELDRLQSFSKDDVTYLQMTSVHIIGITMARFGVPLRTS